MFNIVTLTSSSQEREGRMKFNMYSQHALIDETRDFKLK